MKHTHLVLSVFVAAFGISSVTGQVIVGTDNASASAYSAGWTNLSDGSITGEGAFGQWFLVGSSAPNSGFVISNVTTLGTANTALNSAGVSFGMFASTNAPGYVDAYRFLDPNGLGAGQTFSIQMAVNFRNGNKGFDLRDNTTNNTTIFNFNIGGDDYVVNNAATGNGSIGNAYSDDTLFTLAFTQTDSTGGTWSITRAGGVSDFDTGTYLGVARSFKLYAGGTDNVDGQNYLFVNNLETVPEPSTYALLVGAGLAGWIYRRRLRR